MVIAALRTLRTFWESHVEAEEPLRDWYKRISKSLYRSLNDLKLAFPSVDYVAPYTIFDIAGNSYRLIAIVDYEGQFVKVRHVFTHPEYDQWNKKGKPDATNSSFRKKTSSEAKTKQNNRKQEKAKPRQKKARD
jgi:mRNA interferase HigB